MNKVVPVLMCALGTLPLSAETPDKFVRYVEATGSQYVDTGVTGRWNTKIKAQFEWMNLADSGFVSAGSNGNNTRLYMCYTYKHGSESSENVMYTCAEGKLDEIFYKGSAARWEKNRIYDYVAELSATNSVGETTNKITVDGLQIWNKSSAGLDTGRTLYVFANNKASGTVNAKSKTRCYRLKIWQGPKDGGDMALVRDFIPCVKNGRPGLYDAVNDEIRYSGSGTDLVAADENSEVPDEYVEYVESTGVNFIDTEVAARSGTEAEIEVATLHKRTFRKGLLGAITPENVYFDLFHSYEAKMACSYGTRLTTGGSYSNGERYYFRSSLAAGAQTLVKKSSDAETETVVYEGTDETTIDTGLSLYLFGRNSNGNIADGGIYRLYGLKIRQDGALVRDFRPCLKDGAFALYENVSGRIFYPKRGLLNGPVRQTAVKAKDVIFVDYIESDGTQTLDTGVRARYGTRAKGEFAWATALRTKSNEENTYLEAPIYRNGRCYLGADDPIYWPSFFYMMYAEDRKIWGGYGNGLGDNSVAYGASTSVSMTTAETKYAFDASFMDGEQKVELDGAQIWSLSNSAKYDTGRNIHIFSSGSRYRSAARCYGLEIWQDGEKVRDFKPCVYDNKAMLYDTVTKSIFRPSPDIPASKAGSIILSGEEKPAKYVDYVESDGTIFVDTGVKGKSGTASDMKVRFMEAGDIGIACAYNSSLASDYRRFYLCYNLMKYSNAIQYGYGTAQTAFSAATDCDYVIETALSVGSQTFTVDGTRKITNSDTKQIDTGLNIWLFAFNFDNAPKYPGKTRIYSMKLYQGNADGSNMTLVRDFKPVRLSNGLVALWDFVEKKPYLAQSTTSPYNYVQFPVVGPDGEEIKAGLMIILR